MAILMLLQPPLMVAMVLMQGLGPVQTGRLSYYRAGDGFNAGILACGKKFTDRQVHIAHRQWRQLGCGRLVLVYVSQTMQWAIVPVQDAGPFGVYHGRLARAVSEGRWKVHIGTRAPRGWQWRALVDLSYGLWVELGKPDPLSGVCVTPLPAWVPTLLLKIRCLL